MQTIIVTTKIRDKLSGSHIHFNFRGQGRPKVGSTLKFAKNCEVEPFIGVFDGTHVPTSMGAFSYSHSPLTAGMTIGRYCSIAKGLRVMGPAHPARWVSTSPFSYESFRWHPHMFDFASAMASGYEPPLLFAGRTRLDPQIGHDVWIGQDVLLGQGVTIGHGSIVAAGSIVTKDVAPYTIVGGTPARVIRCRFDAGLIARFLAIKWWQHAFTDIAQFGMEDPERFLDNIEKARAEEHLLDYAPERVRLMDLTLTESSAECAAEVSRHPVTDGDASATAHPRGRALDV